MTLRRPRPAEASTSWAITPELEVEVLAGSVPAPDGHSPIGANPRAGRGIRPVRNVFSEAAGNTNQRRNKDSGRGECPVPPGTLQ
jgi:hypothetical protein